MPQKKVSFNAKPKPEQPKNIDEWVVNRDLKTVDSKAQSEEASIKMKRLTLDIPESLHRAIKKKAVEEGETMADQLRSLLEEHYGN
jgi:predicted DNA binding CopG/RHH family protein